MSSLTRDSTAQDDKPPSGQQVDCWSELEEQAAHADRVEHGSWSEVAALRPTVEDRLTRLVQTIEHDIIPRLVRAHPQAPLPGASVQSECRPQTGDVEKFSVFVMARDDAAINACIAAWRARGTSVETLFVDLLAPAARHLGKLWEDDRCHFADVTVGLGRLQQIMRGLSSAFGTEIEPPAGGRRALLMPAPGDQHTFGLSMVAEFFARAGWEVAGVIDPMPRLVQDKVHNEWFDLVGISAGSSTRLDGLQSCIASVRRHSHNRAIAVMVGGPLFSMNPELVVAVGADGTCSDARHAPGLAESLIARRLKGA